MKRDSADAVYASNVHHYRHVVSALLETFESVHLLRRWEVTPDVYRLLQRMPTPGPILREVGRRVAPTLDGRVRAQGLGPAVTASAFASKLNPHWGLGIRETTASSARRVATVSEGHFLQFVEGLGHAALSRGRFARSFMERRNLHHAAFEVELETFAGYPFMTHADPIADMLETEYALSDRILVYSEVARRSFLERGFNPARVVTVPLGVDVTAVERGPSVRPLKTKDFLYVGRGDAFKGIDLAVAAVQSLGRTVRLRVAGPFEPEALQWLLRQDCVDYLGVLTKSELVDEYFRCAALLAPSIESFGLALIDAAAMDTPILCLPTSGVGPELPDSIVTVIGARDPDEWSGALDRVLSAGERPKVLSGRPVSETWSWRRASEALIDLYAREEVSSR